MDKVRFGIVGIGNMGSGHVRRFVDGEVKGAVLTAVCDIKPDRLEWVKSYCADKNAETPALYDDCTKMLDSGDIDAILIAVPHYDHPVIGIEACFAKSLSAFTQSRFPHLLKPPMKADAHSDLCSISARISTIRRCTI